MILPAAGASVRHASGSNISDAADSAPLACDAHHTLHFVRTLVLLQDTGLKLPRLVQALLDEEEPESRCGSLHTTETGARH